MPPAHGEPRFDPMEAIEGDPASPVWVVGLNPREAGDPKRPRPRPEFNAMTWVDPDPTHVHFRRVGAVIGQDWADVLFLPGGVAHTDTVKCASRRFDEAAQGAVQHCIGFLLRQIEVHKPKVLLVVSSQASRAVAQAAGFADDQASGVWATPTWTCHVVLSGYTSPRQDRYARSRLRRDFRASCEAAGVSPPPVPRAYEDRSRATAQPSE